MTLNKRLVLSIFWLILGIALIVLSALDILDSTMWSGMGGGLCGVAALQIVRNLRLRRSEAYREKEEIAVNDERNRYLRLKAWSWAGYLFVLASGAANIVLLILQLRAYAVMMSFCLCFVLFTYCAAYYILQRRE